ncbi:DUF948 domain-containing protein [Thermithiobacillus plumbiphilus]|uniref:DUF948 domain-containing protein n=1 Tax=Thermithiobacillus plumbiphilus TaxID=1729899 RepID=A0ABU9D556_9PROT
MDNELAWGIITISMIIFLLVGLVATLLGLKTLNAANRLLQRVENEVGPRSAQVHQLLGKVQSFSGSADDKVRLVGKALHGVDLVAHKSMQGLYMAGENMGKSSLVLVGAKFLYNRHQSKRRNKAKRLLQKATATLD